MLSVLMVSTFGPNVRGVSPYADSLVRELKRLADIDIFQLDYQSAFPKLLIPAGTDYSARNEYARVHYLKPWTWKAAGSDGCDVVHFQYWSPALLPMLFVLIRNAKRSSARIVVTWHNATLHERIPLVALLEKRLANQCDRLICHTENGRKILTAAFSGTDVGLIAHGCDPHGIEEATAKDYERCGLSVENDYVLFFGNVRPYKGLDLLLDAWNDLSNEFPKVKLVIAGRLWDGTGSLVSRFISRKTGMRQYVDSIVKRIEKLGQSVICDFGFVPNDRMYSYLRISKLAVFPYRHFESASGAAAQVAGRGLPFVCTPVGGLPELAIDDRFVTKSISAEDVAKTVRAALSNYDASWKRQQLARAEEVSWPEVAEKHARLYESLVSELSH